MQSTVIRPADQLPNPNSEGCRIALDRLEALTGWSLTPEGMCRDDMCVPVRGADFVGDAAIDFAGFARFAGLANARTGHYWAFGTDLAPSLEPATGQAPAFTLSDLEGRLHSLSDFRGRKVFLISWASW